MEREGEDMEDSWVVLLPPLLVVLVGDVKPVPSLVLPVLTEVPVRWDTSDVVPWLYRELESPVRPEPALVRDVPDSRLLRGDLLLPLLLPDA